MVSRVHTFFSSKLDMRRPSTIEKVEAQDGFVELKENDLSYSSYLQVFLKYSYYCLV